MLFYYLRAPLVRVAKNSPGKPGIDPKVSIINSGSNCKQTQHYNQTNGERQAQTY